jgi:hypothetical protein
MILVARNQQGIDLDGIGLLGPDRGSRGKDQDNDQAGNNSGCTHRGSPSTTIGSNRSLSICPGKMPSAEPIETRNFTPGPMDVRKEAKNDAFPCTLDLRRAPVYKLDGSP